MKETSLEEGGIFVLESLGGEKLGMIKEEVRDNLSLK